MLSANLLPGKQIDHHGGHGTKIIAFGLQKIQLGAVVDKLE